MDDGGCVYCDPGTFILTVDMFDSFGDGWNGAQYGIFNDGGTVYQVHWILPSQETWPQVETSFACPLDVILSRSLRSIPWGDQCPCRMNSAQSSTIGAPATYGIDFTLTGQCSFWGICTNPQANNFNPSASIDDGSCQEPPANDLIENANRLLVVCLCRAPSSTQMMRVPLVWILVNS